MPKKKKNTEPVSEENEIILEETPAEEEVTDGVTDEQSENIENDESGTQAADAGNASVGIVANAVNFRTGPSFNKAVIAELKPGAPVKITSTEQGENGVWYQCEYQGKTGYIKATGIKFEQ